MCLGVAELILLSAAQDRKVTCGMEELIIFRRRCLGIEQLVLHPPRVNRFVENRDEGDVGVVDFEFGDRDEVAGTGIASVCSVCSGGTLAVILYESKSLDLHHIVCVW